MWGKEGFAGAGKLGEREFRRETTGERLSWMDRNNWGFELLRIWGSVWKDEKGYVGNSNGRDFSVEE